METYFLTGLTEKRQKINTSIVFSYKVDISHAYTSKAGVFSHLFAAQGMTAGGGGKILEIEMGTKGEGHKSPFHPQGHPAPVYA